MKLDLHNKRAAKKIEKALLRTFKKIYTGENLWLRLSKIEFDYSVSEEGKPPIALLTVECGREEDNLDHKRELAYYGDNAIQIFPDDVNGVVDLSFLCGQFYEALMNK